MARRAYQAQPCSHADIDFAQAQGSRGRRHHQRQEHNMDCAALRRLLLELHR